MQTDSETDSDSEVSAALEGADSPPPFSGNNVVPAPVDCSEVSTIQQALQEVKLLHSLNLDAALEVSRKLSILSQPNECSQSAA